MNISGKFSVQLAPVDMHAESANGNALGRMTLNKSFEGELSATSTGEMLSAMTGTEGSAGYVAIEHVVGTLAGKTGSFVLQHFGIMNRGADRLVLEVVPDSGTGDLAGLSGSMAIEITDGQHFYKFDFELG